jgi:hypothetical protein
LDSVLRTTPPPKQKPAPKLPQICPNSPLKKKPEHLPIHIQNLPYLCPQASYSKTQIKNLWQQIGPQDHSY